MTQFAEIGNTITMSKDFLLRFTIDVAEIAAKTAIEKYKEIQMSEEVLSTSQAAKLLGCTKPTVINYIGNGVGPKKIKLKASRIGDRDYQITRLDLEDFKLKKSA